MGQTLFLHSNEVGRTSLSRVTRGDDTDPNLIRSVQFWTVTPNTVRKAKEQLEQRKACLQGPEIVVLYYVKDFHETSYCSNFAG